MIIQLKKFGVSFLIAALVALPMLCCCLMTDRMAEASVIKEDPHAHCHSAETQSSIPQKHSCDCSHSFLSAVVPADNSSAISAGGNVLAFLPDVPTELRLIMPEATDRMDGSPPLLFAASLPLYLQYSNLRI